MWVRADASGHAPGRPELASRLSAARCANMVPSGAGRGAGVMPPGLRPKLGSIHCRRKGYAKSLYASPLSRVSCTPDKPPVISFRHAWSTPDALISWIPRRHRDTTGLMTVDEAVRQVIPARAKAGQWSRLVRGLIDTPDGTGTAAEASLSQLSGLLARRGLVVLVSDLLLDRELALNALRYLRHRGHQVIVLHVMDPAELDLVGPPEVRLRDPESAASVVVRPRELAGAYAATVRREIAGWRTACRRHGVAYHHIRTDMPFGMALRLLA